MTKPTLDLAIIGNSRIGALIDAAASVVWMCVPRLDGDPMFCALLDDDSADGRFDVMLENDRVVEQAYITNTAILRTVLEDAAGGKVELLDFAPRYYQHGRMLNPVTLVRIARRLAGRPRIRVRFAPRCENGQGKPSITFGSHHIRAANPSYPMRLTTDAPVTHVIESNAFLLLDSTTFILGPDETLQDSPASSGAHMLEETERYWHRWVRNLAVPFEWQDAVIRAAITLKLNTYDDTGGIIAAMTTSIPEAPDSSRNWDYRYCWLRDAYFVVNALNRLGATGSLERYLRYIEEIPTAEGAAQLQPVYGVSGARDLTEQVAPGLAGYLGFGPVRMGNQAYEQIQHDVYGSVVLGASHAFFDRRIVRRADQVLFRQLEDLGERAFASYAVPDSGLWEFRGRREVHTFSAAMCWAACDRLRRIAQHLGEAERSEFWGNRAEAIHRDICQRAFVPEIDSFVGAFDSQAMDASVLMLSEIGFLPPGDARMRSTVEAVERHLRRGHFILRYDREDDFGVPSTAFIVCTFWLIQALALQGDHYRTRAVRKTAGVPQSFRTAVGRHRCQHGPAMGQLSSDLQHGRHHHVRDAIELALGRGVLVLRPTSFETMQSTKLQRAATVAKSTPGARQGWGPCLPRPRTAPVGNQAGTATRHGGDSCHCCFGTSGEH